jgi:hypothetical protein
VGVCRGPVAAFGRGRHPNIGLLEEGFKNVMSKEIAFLEYNAHLKKCMMSMYALAKKLEEYCTHALKKII